MASSAAQAQCAPDPTVANGTTTCIGTDTDGVLVGTSNTAVVVAGDAQVSNIGAPAIAVDVPRSVSGYYATNSITVLGSVSAPGQNAIVATAGATLSPGGSTYQDVTLTIGASGSVSGATAFALVPSPGNTIGTITATVDNAGTLTGTGGIALLGNAATGGSDTTGTLTTFTSITNRSGASIIGAIVGPAPTISNAGSIDGGARSAIDSRLGVFSNITNVTGGVIRSASDAATILTGIAPYYYYDTRSPITNSGTIANAGSGTAIAGSGLSIVNKAGAQISTAGATAIAASAIDLANQGIITGDIVATGGANTIDSAAGTINGSVFLGSGNNTLIARYAGSRTLATGIAGTLTASGAGNVERVVFAADTKVTTPIDLNAGFQQLVLAPDANVTASLEAGFSTVAPLVLSGQGTVINRATLTVGAPVISDLDYGFGSAAAFVNEGSINGSLGYDPYIQPFAVTLDNHGFTNARVVTANGGGAVSISYNPFVNIGSIIATGTGAYVFDGVLTNSGSIVSTGGDGAYIVGNVGYTGSNSGAITGATTGANVGIYLTNTGTISSAGIGVNVQAYGYLINGAGGVVNGGTGGAVNVGPFNAGVANAGTINGDVTFTGSGAYIALSGGTLNGNLTLRDGATLVTDLVNPGTGQFAGITGTVATSGRVGLRYAVNADASATLTGGTVGSFATLGYQIGDGAALTLTAPATQPVTTTLTLSGNGSVDLDATISVTGTNAIQSTSAISYPGAAAAAAGGLSIINHGTIALTRSADFYVDGAVSLLSTDSFTNLGSIAVGGSITPYSNPAAISGGASVTNAGSIALDGGTGIADALAVTNSGIITQRAGGAAATGVTGFATFTNTGTISVSSVAVQLFGNAASVVPSISNSGTLVSTGGAAIASGQYGGIQSRISNEAGGTIVGLGSAIQVYGGTLTNSGTITGTVDLGYAGPTSRSYASSTYIASGGTIAGDLLFGNGDNLLLQTGNTLGVSGMVDGGSGTNIYGRVLSATGTASLDLASTARNFQDRLIAAIGTDTVATSTASGTLSGDLYAIGNGSVVNQASITGTLTTFLPYFPAASVYSLFPTDLILASLTNSGSIGGGVTGGVAQFTNTGAISADAWNYNSAVSLYGDKTLNFINSGTISLTRTVSRPTVTLSAANAVSIVNSGQINGGGLLADLSPADDTAVAMRFANSGTITSTGATPGVDLEIAAYGSSGGTIQIENSGTIAAQTGLGFASGLYLDTGIVTLPLTYTIVNSGMITASETSAAECTYAQGIALFAAGDGGTITNSSSGTIKATGVTAIAILAAGHALNLTNAGTITASGSRSSTAIATADAFDNTIVNTGTINGDIVLAAGADTLDNTGTINGKVSLGASEDRLILRGGTIAGPIDGGDGNDTIDIAGGAAAAAPVAVGSIANIETLRMSAGLATISGAASLGSVALSGGRLVGLAGSTITAPTITVGASATFGSAGTVNGNIAVAGTLSPGASPSTMTVNGNVALAGSSTSLFEITPTVSDKLIVNGTLSIANGATLQLAQIGKVLPGTTLELITASGGITGSFTTVQRNGSAFGLFSQDSTRLRLMATFFNDTTFNATAQRGVNYVNGVLLGGRASPSLLAAVPLLLTASGDTNAPAFMRIAPQAYAAARQVSVDNGLTLADAARGQAFEPTRDTPGLFSFASALGGTRTLDGDPIDGTARATTNGYGFLGGIGFAGAAWSVGAFGGYLNDRQTLAGLGARTSADGVVAGVHGRVRYRGIGVKVTFAYDGARADTRRAVPGGAAQSRYDLRGWTVDGSIDTLAPLTGRWSVRPSVGATMIRTIRDSVTESGNSPFALAVAGRRGTAVFVDAGATFAGTANLGHAVTARPYLTLGARYQAQGRTPYAVAGFGGGAIGLLAEAAARAPVLATATLGVDVLLSPNLAVFGLVSGESGNGDHRASGRGGLRLTF